MSHYEERLQADLHTLRGRILAQGRAVLDALHAAGRALLNADPELGSLTVLRDHPINRETRSIDQACHAFVARHVPSAGHLRFVSAVLRMNQVLERIGDYAVTICREAVQLHERPPEAIVPDIEELASSAHRALEQALQSFAERDADLARETDALTRRRTRRFHHVFTDLLRVADERARSMEDLFGLLTVLNSLERVEDQARNLCEETVFYLTGAMKQPKVYSILFVDEKGDRWGPMAAAIGRKAFPESGIFACAGWDPAPALDERVMAFLDARGYAIPEGPPAKMSTEHDALRDHHVIVSLQGEVRGRLPDPPFHTVILRWDAVHDRNRTDDEALESDRKRIAHELRELMVLLRGEGAA
jgi:phosphate transport system protein